MNAVEPTVSVVVCTYERAGKLAACLDALNGQTALARAEVIVVDDASTDESAQVAAARGARTIRHAENRGPAAARNTGLHCARGNVVAYIDDDCVPDRDWLETLLAAYDDPTVIGVGGPVTALHTDRIWQRYLGTNPPAPLEMELAHSAALPYRAFLYLRTNVRGPVARPEVRRVFGFLGANMSFRRDALEAIGGFDETIAFSGEDEDVCRRLRLRFPEGQFLCVSRARVAHDFDSEPATNVRRRYAYGAGSALGFLRNTEQRPTLFPVPVALAGTAAAAAVVARSSVRRGVLLAALTATFPLLVFPRWLRDSYRSHSPEHLAYAYLQLLEETAHDCGFVCAWWHLRRRDRGRLGGALA